MYPFVASLAIVFLAGLWVPFWLLIQKQLPSNKIRALDVALQGAEDVFRSCVEGGLLDQVTAADLHTRLIA